MRLSLVYDASDAALVEGSWWCLSNGYPSRRRSGRLEYLHVLIAGRIPGLEVDHINRNKLDVRRSNLRHVTCRANKHNLPLMKSNRSGFRGVTRCKRSGKWISVVVLDGKRHFLGRFIAVEDANDAAVVFRGKHMEGAVD